MNGSDPASIVSCRICGRNYSTSKDYPDYLCSVCQRIGWDDITASLCKRIDDLLNENKKLRENREVK